MCQHSTYLKKGSITIETAMVIPFVLAVLVLLIYLGFYYYDAGVLYAVTGEAVTISAHEERIGKKDRHSISALAHELAGEKLIFYSSFEAEEKIEREVAGTFSAERDGTVFGVLNEMIRGIPFQSRGSFSHTAEAPEEKIRTVMALIKWKDALE